MPPCFSRQSRGLSKDPAQGPLPCLAGRRFLDGEIAIGDGPAGLHHLAVDVLAGNRTGASNLP